MGIVKNGRGQTGHGTVKLAVSGIMVFLHVGTNSGKLRVDSMIFVWAWSKMAVVF